MRESIPFLPKAYQEAKLEFDKVKNKNLSQKLLMFNQKIYEGTSIKQPRSLSCSNFVNSKMEYAVGRAYISRYFNGSSKKEAVEMINNLLSEFKAILSESSWIDPISKKHAMEKVNYDYKNKFLSQMFFKGRFYGLKNSIFRKNFE